MRDRDSLILENLYSDILLKENSDEEYMHLAQNPEENKKDLQRMVNDAAKKAGYDTKEWYHGGKFDPLKDTIPKIKEGKKTKSNMQLDFGFHIAIDANEAKQYLPKKGGVLSKLFLANSIVGSDIIDLSNNAKWIIRKSDSEKFGRNISSLIEKQRKMNADFGALADEFTGDIPVYPSQLENILSRVSPSEAVTALTNAGYTGVMYTARANYDNKRYRPFDAITIIGSSSQIKSADPVTYDDGGNIIPLSQRFDSSSDDIRY